MLLAQADVDDNQRVSSLAAATKGLFVATPSTASVTTRNEAHVKCIKYELVISVLRQCSKPNRPLDAHSSHISMREARSQDFGGRFNAG